METYRVFELRIFLLGVDEVKDDVEGTGEDEGEEQGEAR